MFKAIKKFFSRQKSFNYDAAREYNKAILEARKFERETSVRMLSVTHTPREVNNSMTWKEYIDNCRKVDDAFAKMRKNKRHHLRLVA